MALTRAKRAAVLSFAESRFKWGEMTFGRPSRFLSEIDPQYLDLQFELGDSRDSDEEANSAPRYGRPGGPSRYRTPRYGPFAGLRTGRLREKSGCTGYRRAATHRHALARRTFPQPQRPGSHAGLSGNRIASIEILSPGNRPPAADLPVPPQDIRPGLSAVRHPPPHMLQAPRTAPTLPAHPPRRVPAKWPSAHGSKHAKFGVGEIVAIEEWTSDVKLTVDFGAAGRKVLLKKFAKLQIL